jgi:hypothetical protein
LKKNTSIFLLLILVYNLVGLYLVFEILIQEAKRESVEHIALNLPENQLDVLVFNAAEFDSNNSGIEWEEEGKEFRYRDKLFDVVKIEQTGNSVKIYCINDVKEEKLLKMYCEYINYDLSQNHKMVYLLSKIPGYYFQNFINISPSFKGESFKILCIISYKNIIREILTPPPRSC